MTHLSLFFSSARAGLGRPLRAPLVLLVGLVIVVGCDAPAAEAPPAPEVSTAQTPHGESYRPWIGGTEGLVAANHPQAAAAGFDVLMAGGNAIDAVIATGAALGVVEPFMSGLGGNGWMNIYWAETGTVEIVNFSGRAPMALTAEHFAGEEEVPGSGPLTALVPGSPAAWAEVHERYATLDRSRLLEAAIRLAEAGYPITPFGASRHQDSREHFLNWDAMGAESWWGGSDEAPEAGDLVRNPRLAQTYRILDEQGFEAFYTGDIPEEISSFVQRHGGVLAVEDFEAFEATWEDPLHINYRGYDIYNAAPNSSGGLAILQILKILEGFDMAGMGLNSTDYIHHVVEAIKLAAADRAEWSGDPAFMDVEIPFDLLLSEEYAEEQRARIDPQMMAVEPTAGTMQPGTTHYSVVDRHGNMVSVTTTMGSGFGSGVIGGETGVFLNNGVSWFELDPESPAYVEGGKATRWNMGPTLIGRDGEVFIAMGTPGGTGIWQTQPQLITKLLDFEMDPQNAIESPRFRWELGAPTVSVEGRIHSDVVADLEGRGHEVSVVDDWTMMVGGMNAVKLDRATGIMQGGADPRRDGYVMGW